MNWILRLGERDEFRPFNYNGEDWSKCWVGEGGESELCFEHDRPPERPTSQGRCQGRDHHHVDGHC